MGWRGNISMKKVIIVLLLILCITGCSNKAVRDSEEQSLQGTEESQEIAAAVSRELLETDLGQMDHFLLADGICYYTRYEKSEKESGVLLYCCRMEIDGQEEIVYTYETDSDNGFYLMNTCCDREGNWYNLYRKTVQGKDVLFLEKLSLRGEVLFCRQLEAYEAVVVTEGCVDMSVDKKGQVCLLTRQGSLLVWDKFGEEAGKLTAQTVKEEANRDGLGLLDGGETGIYLYWTERDSIFVAHADLEALVLRKAEEVKLSDSSAGPDTASDFNAYETVTVYDGYGGFCYLADEDNLYRYSFADNEVQKLFAWSDSYVNIDRHQLKQIEQQEDGYLFFCYDTVSETSSCITVQLKNPEELSEKTIITLGCSSTIGLEELVQRYNSQSEQYRLEIKTYQVNNGPLDELVEALLLGNGPDIIDFMNISVDYYASKGILEDLAPYLEESGIELVKPVEDALRTDGKLYALSEAFNICGYAVSLEYASGKGLSIRQCMDMARDYPDASLIQYYDRSNLLYAMMIADMDTYVDFESGTCSFTGDEFIRLLEEVSTWKELPAASGDSSVLEGFIQKQYLMTPINIGSMSDYLAFKNAFQEYAYFTGYPNYQGETKYYLSLSHYYGINSASENKDGAWDFIKYLLSDYEQSRTGNFPITQEACEKELKKEPGESDFIINNYTGIRGKAYSPQQEDIDEIQAIMDNLYYFDQIPASILQIMIEEAKTVFEQGKTAGQAAEIIQNRVSLFLQE